MTQKPLTPTRKKQLELYIAGCSRAERRIIIGGRNRLGACIDISRFKVQRPLIEHITSVYSGPRAESFTVALMLIRVARGKLQCELEGLSWQV